MGCGALLGVFMFVGAAFYLWNGLTANGPMTYAFVAVVVLFFGLVAMGLAIQKARPRS